jgi:hypothetical protein
MHAFKRHRQKSRSPEKQPRLVHDWTSVGMRLSFRAEVMPGRERERRTFTVACVLANGRVELKGLYGQHGEAEFEPVS